MCDAEATAAERAPSPGPSTTVIPESPPASDHSAILDGVVLYGSLFFVVVLSLFIPVVFISKEVGFGVASTCTMLSQHALFKAAQSPLGSIWPLSAVMRNWGREYSKPVADLGSLPTHNREGMRIEPLSGIPVADLLAQDDDLLLRYANDPSYTRFEDSAIFFRVLTRKVPISAKSGKPVLRLLGHITGGDRSRLPEAREHLRRQQAEETQRANQDRIYNVNPEGTGPGSSGRRRFAETYGMAEIDPLTHTLHSHPMADPRPIRCVHALSEIYGDYIIAVLKGNYVLDNTYLNHAGDPFGTLKFPIDNARPCLRRILTMMCIGDKWEVICPLNMTHTGEKIQYRSMTIQIDIKDLGGVTANFTDAMRALALGVYLTEKDDATADVFTREMFLERSKLGLPQITI